MKLLLVFFLAALPLTLTWDSGPPFWAWGLSALVLLVGLYWRRRRLSSDLGLVVGEVAVDATVEAVDGVGSVAEKVVDAAGDLFT